MMNERSPCGVGMWWGGGSRGEQGAKDCQRACCVGARCALPVGSEVIVDSFLHIWGPLLPREGPDANAAGWVARVGCGGEGTRSAQLVADEVDTAAPRRRWALGRERAWPRGKGRERARRNLWGGAIPSFSQALPERTSSHPGSGCSGQLYPPSGYLPPAPLFTPERLQGDGMGCEGGPHEKTERERGREVKLGLGFWGAGPRKACEILFSPTPQ